MGGDCARHRAARLPQCQPIPHNHQDLQHNDIDVKTKNERDSQQTILSYNLDLDGIIEAVQPQVNRIHSRRHQHDVIIITTATLVASTLRQFNPPTANQPFNHIDDRQSPSCSHPIAPSRERGQRQYPLTIAFNFPSSERPTPCPPSSFSRRHQSL